MVSARHSGRLRNSVTAANIAHSWEFLCNRTPSPWSQPTDLPAPRPRVTAWEKEPAPSTSVLVQRNLSAFWASFNPYVDLPTPDDIFPDEDDGLDVLRWRSAPWGEDVWDDDVIEQDAVDDPSDTDDVSSIASDVPSLPSSSSSAECLMSGVPLRHRLLPGRIHLLNPKVHKLSSTSSYVDLPVNPVVPIRLRCSEREWYYNMLHKGIHLPRPKDAPALFKVTRSYPLMDTVIQTWVDNGLLVPESSVEICATYVLST